MLSSPIQSQLGEGACVLPDVRQYSFHSRGASGLEAGLNPRGWPLSLHCELSDGASGLLVWVRRVCLHPY